MVFHDQHDWRAQHIPEFLSGYDVVVLQEAFSEPHRNTILSALSEEYPYNSGILGEDEFLSFNGGVIILSRWPILRTNQTVFEGCEGSDCMVKKGAVYVALQKHSRAFNIFGLHFQAQKEYRKSRVAQFPQLKAFIDRQNIPSSEPVFVAGDFNVDYFSGEADGEFANLLDTVKIALPVGTIRPSYDQKTNTLVQDAVSERLDYVMHSQKHLLPTAARNEVLYFRKQGEDLSDHHAVAGHFVVSTAP